jgi:hypothetical protein
MTDAGALLVLLVLCSLSALPATIALVLLADGDWIGGYILLCLALICLGFLLSAINRESSGPLGRQALAVATRAQVRGRMVCTSVRAWSRAVGPVLRGRRGQQRLYAARRDRLAALSEAILRGDRARAALLTAETRALREESQAHDEEVRAAITSAREQIERERAATERPSTRLASGVRARTWQ